jgi:hypothetical protein
LPSQRARSDDELLSQQRRDAFRHLVHALRLDREDDRIGLDCDIGCTCGNLDAEFRGEAFALFGRDVHGAERGCRHAVPNKPTDQGTCHVAAAHECDLVVHVSPSPAPNAAGVIVVLGVCDGIS